MGYELDIKRNSENIITLTEWQEYIKNDPEFDATEEFSGTTKEGDTLTISTPNAGLWKNKVPFTFTEKLGHITVKNPDDDIIKKMVEIAKSVDAIVVGEEGEEYDENYFSQGFQSSSNKKPWWKLW